MILATLNGKLVGFADGFLCFCRKLAEWSHSYLVTYTRDFHIWPISALKLKNPRHHTTKYDSSHFSILP